MEFFEGEICMDSHFDVDKLLTLHSDLIDISRKYSDLNILLCDDVFENYNVLDIKQQLLYLFSKFQSARYFIKTPIEEKPLVLSPTFARREGYKYFNESMVENAVATLVDNEILLTSIYNHLIMVARKLTIDEVEYFYYTFITHRTEETIAFKMGVCKTSLQRIKKSCLVKLWVEYKDYFE